MGNSLFTICPPYSLPKGNLQSLTPCLIEVLSFSKSYNLPIALNPNNPPSMAINHNLAPTELWITSAVYKMN